MPYQDAADRERRLREDLARLDRIIAAGAMTQRQYDVARRRIESRLAAEFVEGEDEHGTS